MVDSFAQVEAIFSRDPGMWLPDNLFLLQEYLPHDPERGIVRLEFLGDELLYAMRVVTHGRFNLCPSPVCNPDDGAGACELPQEPTPAAPPVEFYPFPEVPQDAVETAQRIAARQDSTSAASNISRPSTAGASSTTSTPTPTCGRPWPRPSASTRSTCGGLPGGSARETLRPAAGGSTVRCDKIGAPRKSKTEPRMRLALECS